MPRRALRCVVDLDLLRVSAPGVWLPSREDVYISISIFGQYRCTRNSTSVFPLLFHQPFRFEKTYYTALDPSDVAEFLEDELVVIELLQYSDYSEGAVRLASFSCSAREFLYPYPTLCPSYTSSSRELLMSRTIAFPGISPKLEFSTKTVIKESRSPELDALEDALEEEKIVRRGRSRSRSRSRARGRSVSRSRSLSRTRTCRSKSAVRTYADDSLSDTDTGNKQPFVVRRLDKSLIGRTPGAPPAKTSSGKKKRSRSRPSSALGTYSSYDDYSRRKPRLHLKEVIRDDIGSLPVYTTKYVSDSESDDAEVAALTSRPLYVPPRPRSTSPYLYKPSYSERFAHSPSPLLSTADRVELAIERAKIRARARALSRSPSPVRPITPILRGSLEDLAIDTSIVKNRRYYPSVLA